MLSKNTSSLLMLLGLAVTSRSACAVSELISLGDDTRVRDISADGQVVVGNLRTSNEAFRWMRRQGLEGLGFLDNHDASIAGAISADGRTIAGASWNTFTEQEEAFRWTEDEGMLGLGDLEGSFFGSFGQDISADGNKVVGRSWALDIPGFGGTTQGFAWELNSEIREIGPPESPNHRGSTATSISNDGALIVGTLKRTGEDLVWLWDDENMTLAQIGDGFTNGGDGRPKISGDGTTVIGTKRRDPSKTDRVPFRWTEESGAVPLHGWNSNADSYVTAVSHDGATVFGWDWESNENIFWHEKSGPRSFLGVLADEYGLSSAANLDWLDIQAITPDGLTLVGNGAISGEGTEGWMLSLDRPIHWIAGDTDLDFDVDFADFLSLSQGFGGPGNWEDGDFDVDGTVDFADFLLLSSNFGREPLSVSAKTVPEPAGKHWLSTLLTLILFFRLRRSSQENVTAR